MHVSLGRKELGSKMIFAAVLDSIDAGACLCTLDIWKKLAFL